ncbi:hypothetical protein [Oscillatoria salina]|uniref:hypothetical protein n=1 Tax=Oscillatoria salina TaxID=331517 RepID=UPI0013B6F226|nr:hypothetical protein [Oscillatoria salina]MBZ8180951.1 hypothetical protein [Oscillatoria salina IIICB1]NET87892.1 hypothetical protein [Kamptonema sp. SIO1D9]
MKTNVNRCQTELPRTFQTKSIYQVAGTLPRLNQNWRSLQEQLRMYNFGIENQIPSPPSRRKNIIDKFSNFLMFSPLNLRQMSLWVTDYELEKNFKTLLKLYPDRDEKAWLVYFLGIVRDSAKFTPEREIARKHLWAYYQEVCFWTTRKSCRYFYSNIHQWETLPIWDWEDFFQHGGETFHNLERIAKDLHNFQPKISTKEYIKIICQRNISKWIDQEIGKTNLITTISFNCSQTEESLYLTKTKPIDRAVDEQTNVEVEIFVAKQEQEKVLSVLESELRKVEADAFQTNPRATIGKAKIPHWTIFLLNYGLNLKQQLTANLLTANQLPIDQSTISRFLDNFRLKIILKIVVSIPEALRENLDLSEGEEQLEKQPYFQEFLKNNKKYLKKEIDNLLKEICNYWLYSTILITVDPDTKTREKFEQILRFELNKWFVSNFKIDLDLEPKLIKIDQKVNLVVTNWAKETVECKKLTQ